MTSPAQRSTKMGAILFGVAYWVHIHLKPTSMCGINFVGGGGAQYPPPLGFCSTKKPGWDRVKRKIKPKNPEQIPFKTLFIIAK